MATKSAKKIADDALSLLSTGVIPLEMRQRLEAALPQGAVTIGGAGRGLSSIRPIFVTERLNDVFGMGGWQYRVTNSVVYNGKETGQCAKQQKNMVLEDQVNHVVVFGELIVYAHAFGSDDADLVFPSMGGSTNADIGDMFKGALSDGLTKAAATYLGIGSYVYKNQPAPSERNLYNNAVAVSVSTAPAVTPEQKECPQCLTLGKNSMMTFYPAGEHEGKPYPAFHGCGVCKMKLEYHG